MKILRSALLVAGFCLYSLILSQEAQAVTLQFQLSDHPNAAQGINGTMLDAMDYGLRLDNKSSGSTRVNTFGFIDVMMTVLIGTGDPATDGDINISGRVVHRQSGEFWHIDADLNGIGKQGSWNTGTVPYDTMFDDLLNHATVGYGNSITHNGNTLNLSLLSAADPTDGYKGPLSWTGKGSGGNDHYISYRHRLTHSNFAGPEWEKLVGSGWWQPVGHSWTATDDFLYVMTPKAVPEPATALLFGAGAAFGLIRRRLLS